MEVKAASDVELSSSQKRRARALRSKRKKKAMMEQEIESGNAESEEEKGTCLETEQSSPPRKKRKRKMKGNNSSTDEKKTDSFLKEESNSLTNTLSETDSNVRTLDNTGSEPGPKEEPACSETKRKKKKKKKKKAESVLELKDKQEDENKVSASHLKGSDNLVILENLPVLEGTRLNESKTKRKKKKKKKKNKTKLGVIENGDISSKSNVKDDNEAGNKNMCAETQIIDGKEDLMSVFEAVESKNTKKVSVEAFGCNTGAESDLKGRKRKKRKKSNESPCKNEDRKDIEIETGTEQVIPSPFPREGITYPKKLLILDLNGILVDVVQNTDNLVPHAILNGKGVFKRPFCDDFLDFCLRTFDVGIWSSRLEANVNYVVKFLIGKQRKRELVFCWNRKMCTITKFKTLENQEKPLVLKELRLIWDKRVPRLPCKKYDESNTLLLDDSPYKALRNPPNTAIFPYPYQYTDAEDCSLASGGDIRKYLERLAAAENVQKFVEQNPFGQPAITEADPHWDFYSRIQKIRLNKLCSWHRMQKQWK